MSRIFVFLLVTCVAMTLAYPTKNSEVDGGVLLTRVVRSGDPGYRHGSGHGSGYHRGYGGSGGFGRYPSGGNTFSQSSANSAAISTPFGSASFANANSNSGAFGR